MAWWLSDAMLFVRFTASGSAAPIGSPRIAKSLSRRRIPSTSNDPNQQSFAKARKSVSAGRRERSRRRQCSPEGPAPWRALRRLRPALTLSYMDSKPTLACIRPRSAGSILSHRCCASNLVLNR